MIGRMLFRGARAVARSAKNGTPIRQQVPPQDPTLFKAIAKDVRGTVKLIKRARTHRIYA